MLDLTRRAVLLAPAAAAAVPGSIGRVPFGPHTIPRLIPGGNPVSGTSHVSAQLDSEMRDYFTSTNIKKLLAACEQSGIDTWQSRADRHIMRILHEYRLEGGHMQWIAQTATEYAELKRNLAEIAMLKPVAIYHHGASTDKLWNAGQLDQLRDNLKAIRQAGALTGLGTHIPEVVEHAESKGWDVDFYMTCVYRLSRSREEASRLAGREIRGELFWDADREQMLSRVAQCSKPCLIFKVYGATRLCATEESRLEALKLVFRYAKPSDALVIGMFPKYSEQVRENCRLLGAAAIPRS